MAIDVAAEVARLERLSVDELRQRYLELFDQPTRTSHKTWLVKRIVWRLQVQTEGHLSDAARQRARTLAQECQLELVVTKPPRHASGPADSQSDRRIPAPGSIIKRAYKGRVLEVKVRHDGFEFEGALYKSLSALATTICGSHCNGFLFFRLGKYGENR